MVPRYCNTCFFWSRCRLKIISNKLLCYMISDIDQWKLWKHRFPCIFLSVIVYFKIIFILLTIYMAYLKYYHIGIIYSTNILFRINSQLKRSMPETWAASTVKKLYCIKQAFYTEQFLFAHALYAVAISVILKHKKGGSR